MCGYIHMRPFQPAGLSLGLSLACPVEAAVVE